MNKYAVFNEKGETFELNYLFQGLEASFWKNVLKVNEENVSKVNPMKLMRKMKWVDYEPASDKGHYRFYPTGTLIFNLLSDWLESIMVKDFEALPIITPFIFNWKNPSVVGQAGMFEKNIYHVLLPDSPEEDFVLRFNDDVGLFQIVSNIDLREAQMPIRFYELTRSFRYIQKSKISGIGRGRTFMLADMHSFCTTPEASLKEYIFLHTQSLEILSKVNKVPYSLVKVPYDFIEMAKPIITAIAKADRHPVVVQMMPKQRQYWNIKHIVHTAEGHKIVHVQLDFENSERYNVSFSDTNNIKKYGPIVHTSLASVEKWMVIFLEEALKKEIPEFPLWLSPTQLRILPVSEKNLPYCIEMAKKIRENNIRVDVDDRDMDLRKKIKHAETEWIPYIGVCGDKEENEKNISIRTRAKNQQQMSLCKIVGTIRIQTESKPFRSLPNILVSKFPLFKQ